MSRVMMPGAPLSGPQQTTALVHYPNQVPGAQGQQSPTMEGRDATFERPPLKGNAELFNPKAASARGSVSSNGQVKDNGLTEKMGSISLADGAGAAGANGDTPVRASPTEQQHEGTGESSPASS